MSGEDRRKNDPLVHTRLAVLEDRNARQSKDIKEILGVVKATSEKIIECTVKVEALDKLDLPTRLTKVETRQKIYAGLAGAGLTFVGGLVVVKDYIISLFT